MRTLALATFCALLASCTAPVPSVTPLASPPPAGLTGVPSASATSAISPGQAIGLICLPALEALPMALQPQPTGLFGSPGYTCPELDAAADSAVTPLGHAVRAIAIVPAGFICGAPFFKGLCPIAQSQFPPAAYVTFAGTKEVAALTFAPPSPPEPRTVRAMVVAFAVPPDGWTMPSA